MNFLNENSHKTDLKCHSPRLSDEKKIHSKLTKAAINGICFSFLSYIIISDLYLLLKRIVLKNCVKTFQNELCEILDTCIKGSSPLL